MTEATNSEFVWVVSAQTAEGKRGGIMGLFTDKEEAIHQITKHQSANLAYEYYFRYMIMEKYWVNSFGNPAVVIGKDYECKFFKWEMDAPVDPDDVPDEGSFVECERPEWAKQTFGF